MSQQTKLILGILAALVVVNILPLGWFGTLLTVALIGVPVAGYFMLDESQRRKLRERGRKRLGP